MKQVSVSFQYDVIELHTASGISKFLRLAVFRVEPIREGYGSQAVKMLIHLADSLGCRGVMGFADMGAVGFYNKCGWFISKDHYEGKFMVCSVPVILLDEIKETW